MSWLHRAIVSLPQRLAEYGRPMQERIVFFETPTYKADACEHLLKVLALAWNTTPEDFPDGCIYNLHEEFELLDRSAPEHGDTRLLEIGWGGTQHVTYADPADVDMFVSPRVQARLLDAFMVIEQARGCSVEPFADGTLAHTVAMVPTGILRHELMGLHEDVVKGASVSWVTKVRGKRVLLKVYDRESGQRLPLLVDTGRLPKGMLSRAAERASRQASAVRGVAA